MSTDVTPGNTQTWTDFLNAHAAKNYKWQEWDCFSLCKEIRQFFSQPELPSFDYIYEQYNEETFPNFKLQELMVANCKIVTNYQDFDLVLIRKNELDNIGTFYQGKIIYMGARYSVCSNLENVLPIISKIYRY